jgi:hypothetical protein
MMNLGGIGTGTIAVMDTGTGTRYSSVNQGVCTLIKT